jgi:DNA-binding NarL/FixJ family response regulator
MSAKTRVMIVDDHVLVAKALSELIGEQDDIDRGRFGAFSRAVDPPGRRA